MMIKVEDECVGCPPDIGCLGDQCPYKNVHRCYCDECEEENQLYWFNGQQLCLDCIEARLERVECDE